MKTPDTSIFAASPAALALLAALPLGGCQIFSDQNDHILFVDYNKIGVSTSGVASGAYEPVLNVGWTGGKVSIIPTSIKKEETTPSMLAIFSGTAANNRVSLGNTFAVGPAADSLASKVTVISIEVNGDKEAIKEAVDGQGKVALANLSAAEARRKAAEADQAASEKNYAAEQERIRALQESVNAENTVKLAATVSEIAASAKSGAGTLQKISESFAKSPPGAPPNPPVGAAK